MVCTFEVVMAVTLTAHCRGELIHLKENRVAPKPPDPNCKVARLDVIPFTSSCLRPQPHRKLPDCLFTYTYDHTVNTVKAPLSFTG